MVLKQVESQDVEFKSSWRDEYFKVISGFASAEGGGNLIIGVDDDGRRYRRNEKFKENDGAYSK